MTTTLFLSADNQIALTYTISCIQSCTNQPVSYLHKPSPWIPIKHYMLPFHFYGNEANCWENGYNTVTAFNTVKLLKMTSDREKGSGKIYHHHLAFVSLTSIFSLLT